MSSKLKSDSKKKALPAAAIKMAKRMGVNLDGFELEAEEIWKKLDDMAANKPVEYQVVSLVLTFGVLRFELFVE